jgi:hypothetical protein
MLISGQYDPSHSGHLVLSMFKSLIRVGAFGLAAIATEFHYPRLCFCFVLLTLAELLGVVEELV